ncbi:hypothetical protein F5Y08DRAFT_334609 [Xylaria arbuscula]|nr:hypothetical protein F5Y08DRAFT_334609 [Xylaria arbuscula]
MKSATPVAFLLHAVVAIAAPIASLQAASPVTSNVMPVDASPEPVAGPPSWRLDCGAPGITSLCSASNSGAHCDPITGALTIILAGTCGACKCIAVDQCTGRCG